MEFVEPGNMLYINNWLITENFTKFATLELSPQAYYSIYLSLTAFHETQGS
jgi:hypothetical protein